MDIFSSFHDPALCRALLDRLTRDLEALGRPVRFMEVCGTHTVSIFRSGLRSLLPEGLEHLSGPGCPVCVTHDSEVDLFIRAAEKPNVIVATFGDLLRVPGPDGRSLKNAAADGARVQVVYSPLDAVKLAAEHPGDMVVFPSVGFETTAPVIAGAVMAAKKAGLSNFCIVPCNKLVPPAMRALLAGDEGASHRVDAFLLPGHVAVVLCLAPFAFLAEEFGRPAAGVSAVPWADVSRYCSLKTTPIHDNYFFVDDMIEKPKKGQEFSNYSILGRVLLTPEIYDILAHTKPGAGGEIQLTDAMAEYARNCGGMTAVEFTGTHYDMGNKLRVVEAQVELALQHPEIGEAFRAYLKEFCKTL